MSVTMYRVDYRPKNCIGLSIAGFSPSEKAANFRKELLERLAVYPISEIHVVPVTFKARGKRRRVDERV